MTDFPEYVVPILAASGPVAIAIVVLRLPNVYESTTLVVVKPPTIPDSVAPSLTVDLTLLLNNINQVVTSRSTLEPLVLKYHPFDAVDAVQLTLRVDGPGTTLGAPGAPTGLKGVP